MNISLFEYIIYSLLTVILVAAILSLFDAATYHLHY